MLWDSLRAIQTSTRCEFAPWLAKAHHFVRLPSGRWCRTLGVPEAPDGRTLVHVRGRVWHTV